MAIIDDFNKNATYSDGKIRKFKSDIFNTQNWKYDKLMMNLYVLITKE